MIQLSEIVEVENRPSRPTRKSTTATAGGKRQARRFAQGTGVVSTVEAPPEWAESDALLPGEETTPER